MFLSTNFTPDQVSTLYSNYYPRSSFSLEQYRPHTERTGFLAWLDGARSAAFRWVPRNVRILDVGCGFGEALGYHKARGCDVYGVEVDENVRRVAKRFGHTVKVGLFCADDYRPASFDYVTMDQVLEHMQDPSHVLQDVAKVLKPGGLAVLSIPNVQGWGRRVFGEKWIHWHAPYHLHFFSVQSIKYALSRAGLDIVHTQTITNSEWLGYQWLHLLTYPANGSASKFWSADGQYRSWEKVVVKVLSVLHRARLNHLITRVFDSVGVGDNRVFLLRKK